ncbi:hypothetical protein ASG92_24340 [Arthrobacter sp. Soil736]|uniref:hypothetical protein n=1 Tax=Arthrobacter sp. Soil736 TaxID=1736395 RepID=UPI0006F34130|nr:hypothetical protein [Arthrobacter sp. Soil736]KRE54828.1 hypothetical protein ASG92_24340 [Arthrobacter sp. Soil736]
MAILGNTSSRRGMQAASAVVGGVLLLTGSIIPAHAVVPAGSSGTVSSSKSAGTWAAADLAATALTTDLVCPVTDELSGAVVFLSDRGAETPAVTGSDVRVESLYSFTQDALFQMSLDANGNLAASSTLENGFRDSSNAAVADMAATVKPNHPYSIGYVCTQQSADFATATVNAVSGKPVAAWATLTTDAAGQWTISAAQGTFSSVATPTISGTAAVGYTLTAKTAAPVPAPDATTFQWLRNGSPIGGATASAYKQVAADQGQKISVRVRHTKAEYDTAEKVSAAMTVQALFSGLVAPKLSGTAATGYVLKSTFTWPSPRPTAITYRWLRNGVIISGATAATYKLTALDRGKQIRSRVSFYRTGYLATYRDSTAVVPKAVFTSVTAPGFSGTTAVGYTVRAAVRLPSPAPAAIAYQWLRNGVPIYRATGASYRLTAMDRGKQLRLRVQFIRSGYLTATATSAYRVIR